MDMAYQEYLASREWAVKREAVRKRSGNKCERCYTNPQQAVHHKTYERVGNERLEDLIAICHPCHEFLSAKSSIDPVSDGVKVYLAGPITNNPWRESLFIGDQPTAHHWSHWAVRSKVLQGGFDCTGPWFLDLKKSNHRVFANEPNTHGQNVCETGQHGAIERSEDQSCAVIESCCTAIRRANVIFAWIPNRAAFGTIWELGFAAALGKTIFLRFQYDDYEAVDDMWFAAFAPKTSWGLAKTVDEAWNDFLSSWPYMRREACL